MSRAHLTKVKRRSESASAMNCFRSVGESESRVLIADALRAYLGLSRFGERLEDLRVLRVLDFFLGFEVFRDMLDG